MINVIAAFEKKWILTYLTQEGYHYAKQFSDYPAVLEYLKYPKAPQQFSVEEKHFLV